MTWKIEPRYGAEIYVGEQFDICIKQDQGHGQEQVVILSRDEARDLIRGLESKIKEAEELYQQEAENE